MSTLPFSFNHLLNDISFNPVALRKTKIVCNFGRSECSRNKRKCFPLRADAILEGLYDQGKQTGLKATKLFMFNSAKHEVLNVHKYENIKKFSIFSSPG